MNGTTLFSCAGTGEYYLKQNGIHIKVANELLEDRAKLYQLNYPDCEMVIGDICKDEIKQKIIMKNWQKIRPLYGALVWHTCAVNS